MLPGSDAGRLVVVLGGGGGVWGRRGGGKGSQHLEKKKKKKNEKPTPPAPPSVVEGKYTNHCTTGVLASSRQDKEDRDQDVGSCGSLTCLVYIVCTIYARRESNSDPLLSSCVGEDAFGGGGISLNSHCRFVRYIPQALRRDTHAKPKKDGRERPTRPDRATRPERARGGPCRRVFGGGATITTSLSLRSRLGGRNEKENGNGNASRRVAVCGRKGGITF